LYRGNLDLKRKSNFLEVLLCKDFASTKSLKIDTYSMEIVIMQRIKDSVNNLLLVC